MRYTYHFNTSIPPKRTKGHAEVNVSGYIAQRKYVCFFLWFVCNQYRNPLIGSIYFLFNCMWTLVTCLVPIKRGFNWLIVNGYLVGIRNGEVVIYKENLLRTNGLEGNWKSLLHIWILLRVVDRGRKIWGHMRSIGHIAQK